MKHSNTTELDAICRKISYRILPLIVLMFALAMLDRTNISFVKSHIEVDLGIGESAYALGAGIFFIAYALFEVPSNLVLQKIGAKIWLSRIMITWGLVTMAMIFVQGEKSFYLLRFLLGMSEAGFSPGIILYLSYFFPPSHRSKAYGIYQMGVPLAFVFGSMISGALLEYAPNLYFKNWQFMFFVQGAFTALVGVFAFFLLSSKPKDAKWLNSKEKELLTFHLQNANEKAKSYTIKEIFYKLLVWKFVFVYFCIQLSVYGVIFYLPSKLAEFLKIEVGFEIGLLSASVWVCVFFALPLLTAYADKKQIWHLLSPLLLFCAGVSMLISSFVGTLFVFLVLMSVAGVGFLVIQPLFWNLFTQILKEGRSLASAIAFVGSLGNLGGFVAPTLKTQVEKYLGANTGIIVLACIAFLGVLMLLHLKGLYEKGKVFSKENQ